MQITLFSDANPKCEISTPAVDRILSGEPRHVTENYYEDPSERFFAGIWSSSVGSWRIEYAPGEEEFCVLIEGQARITSDAGIVAVLKAGDTFVIPGGFCGIWENISPVKKYYAIALLPAAPA